MIAALLELDTRIFLALHRRFSEGGWLALMCVLTVIGSGWGGLAVVPLFVSPRSRRFAVSLTAVMAVTAVVVFVLKAIVQRRRPYLVVPGVRTLIFEAPTDFSFPSGHAAGSFAVATFIAVVLVRHAVREPRRKKRRVALSVVALTMAFGVGMSRCVLGVHFPLDVTVGALIGGFLGTIGARWHLRRVAIPQS